MISSSRQGPFFSVEPGWLQTLEMETGIVYALIAGLLWGASPVLVKRGLVSSDVSAATLFQQGTIVVVGVLVLRWGLVIDRFQQWLYGQC